MWKHCRASSVRRFPTARRWESGVGRAHNSSPVLTSFVALGRFQPLRGSPSVPERLPISLGAVPPPAGRGRSARRSGAGPGGARAGPRLLHLGSARGPSAPRGRAGTARPSRPAPLARGAGTAELPPQRAAPARRAPCRAPGCQEVPGDRRGWVRGLGWAGLGWAGAVGARMDGLTD